MPRPSDRFREFAQVGAAVRLGQLRDEIRQILTAFPALRFQKRSARGAGGSVADDVAARAAKSTRRKKRRFSAAQKKAISDRMKKYWANRKKG
jgi:hypothetical protein